MRIKFTDEVIQGLFGHEAAEDEEPSRLRQYYVKLSTYDQVTANLPIRILVGHKGIGKSAMFQIALAEDKDQNRLTVEVQPDDIIKLGDTTTDFLETIRSWKSGLLEILETKALKNLGATSADTSDRMRRFGGRLIEFLRQTITTDSGVSLEPSRKAIAEHFLRTSEISVYIDDLDRGWQGRPQDITRISALLNAVRDIANDNRGVRFKISLRSDVYFLARTSDESTDKIEGSVVWQSWSNYEIFALLTKRITTYLGNGSKIEIDNLESRPQVQLAKYLSPIFESRFMGAGHWANAPTYRVLMSLIRKRPRDLVKLCTLAAKNAQSTKNSIITTKNLEDAFEEYSMGRIQDTINEFRSELPDIDRLLFGMKPNTKERRAKQGYTYNTADLLAKIRNIREQGEFTFKSRRIRATDQELAAFLYKINFLTARREQPDGTILRRYFEESRYLQSKFVDFGFDWEVHPAYRWALQPDDIGSIFRNLALSSDLSN